MIPQAYIDEWRQSVPWQDEKPANKQKGDIFTFYFKFQPEGPIDAMRKIKVEINCRERTPYFGNKEVPYEISNSFFSGKANISTFEALHHLSTGPGMGGSKEFNTNMQT